MSIVDLDPIVRIRLILLIIIYLLSTYLFSYSMRRYLKIEKREGFFRKYVNSKHKKMEHVVTGISIAILLIIYFNDSRALSGVESSFKIFYTLFTSIIVTEVIRVFMEWKYSTNRREYILTLSELIFNLVIISMAFISNAFGLFR